MQRSCRRFHGPKQTRSLTSLHDCALSLSGGVQRHRSQRPQLIRNGPVPQMSHERRELLRPEKSSDGGRQILVCVWISREQAAYLRQQLAAIPAIEITREARRRLAKFQDRQRAARFQHAPNLSQSVFIICEIAKTEGRRDQIKRGIGKGELQSIRLEEAGRYSQI